MTGIPSNSVKVAWRFFSQALRIFKKKEKKKKISYNTYFLLTPDKLFHNTMKLFESQHHFNYSWEQVTAANWQKYPNELATHVVSVDILNREIDATKNTLKTERLIACKQPIPKWLRALVGGDEYSFVREISVVDLNKRTLVMKSANMTMSHLLLVNETVTYQPDTELPNSRTIFKQEAEITAFSSWSGICNKLEEWSVERFGQNAKIGKRGFETVLKALTEKWTESNNAVMEVGSTILREIDEVNDKTQEVLHDVSEITHEVISDVSVKTNSVLSQVRRLGNVWSRN